jgi:hypothetical protein
MTTLDDITMMRPVANGLVIPAGGPAFPSDTASNEVADTTD